MNEPYTIDIIDDEFYSTHFSLSSKAFEERIYLYAECSKNPDFRKQDDYYFLELFFSVGSSNRAWGDRTPQPLRPLSGAASSGRAKARAGAVEHRRPCGV